MKYLRDTAIESNAPFIALTETHLKPDILDPEVKIEGWSLYRTDRGPGKSHGGVAIYLRNDLIGQLVASHSNIQRPKKSELSGWQLSTRKNFPDEVRKSFLRQKNA